MGIIVQHSAPHNPKANFSERVNQSLKRKVNSFLRQEEQKGTNFTCDICQLYYSTADLLKKHLDSHPDLDIEEAFVSPKLLAKNIIDQELVHRKNVKSYNWLQTIPAVLWSMRTAISSTRGASPFELMFGKKPNLSSDLLFGQQVKKPNNPGDVREYLMQKTQRNELANVYAKTNLQK